MVSTFTYKLSLVKIDAHTHTQSNTKTTPQTGPITIHCAGPAKLKAQCKT